MNSFLFQYLWGDMWPFSYCGLSSCPEHISCDLLNFTPLIIYFPWVFFTFFFRWGKKPPACSWMRCVTIARYRKLYHGHFSRRSPFTGFTTWAFNGQLLDQMWPQGEGGKCWYDTFLIKFCSLVLYMTAVKHQHCIYTYIAYTCLQGG